MTAPDPGDRYASWDAAYVLGALAPEEAREFTGHLAGCPSCAAAVAELRELPGLLAQVPADQRAAAGVRPPVDPPPAGLLPRLLLASRARRRRRTVLAAVAAVALLGALGGGALALGYAPRPAPPAAEVAPTVPGGTAVTLAPVNGSTALQASAVLVERAWGTEVQLRCRYTGAVGRYRPGGYVLVAVDRAGGRQQMAAWSVVPDRWTTITGATAWQRSDLAALEVQADTGEVALRWTAPPG